MRCSTVNSQRIISLKWIIALFFPPDIQLYFTTWISKIWSFLIEISSNCLLVDACRIHALGILCLCLISLFLEMTTLIDRKKLKLYSTYETFHLHYHAVKESLIFCKWSVFPSFLNIGLTWLWKKSILLHFFTNWFDLEMIKENVSFSTCHYPCFRVIWTREVHMNMCVWTNTFFSKSRTYWFLQIFRIHSTEFYCYLAVLFMKLKIHFSTD